MNYQEFRWIKRYSALETSFAAHHALASKVVIAYWAPSATEHSSGVQFWRGQWGPSGGYLLCSCQTAGRLPEVCGVDYLIGWVMRG